MVGCDGDNDEDAPATRLDPTPDFKGHLEFERGYNFCFAHQENSHDQVPYFLLT